MSASIVGALIACAGGAVLAFGNDRMTRAVCARKPSLLTPFFAVRQAVNVAYLAALYLLSPALPWGMTPLLIGGALGVTVPSLFFAARLAREMNAQKRESESQAGAPAQGKERE